MALMVRGPVACFASWLAQSTYNEQIEVQKFLKKSDLAVNTVALDQRLKDRSITLQVEKVKSVKEGFEKDPNIVSPKFYLVDGYFVISERVKEGASSSNSNIKTAAESIQEIEIRITADIGWSPTSQLERDISTVVKRWKREQTAMVSLVGAIAQIAAMSLASIKANNPMDHRYSAVVLGAMVLLQGLAILSAYRAMELQHIDDIPTLGHWVAHIRRYSYLYGKSYAENRYVQKYLAPSELDYFKITCRPGKSSSSSPEGQQIDREEVREKRMKYFEKKTT